MKRNSMCPVCYLKMLLNPSKRNAKLDIGKKYDNGVALTPPMGWASWNTFRNNIDEDLIYDTAKAMVEKGLAEAGYEFVNIDDCWHSNLRDQNGEMQGDLVRFRHGIPSIVAKINDLGLKVGIYSSNGTLTCEDLPASLGNEQKDAYTFAKWGIEYFKYDYCHNEMMSKYAPLVYSISIAPVGEKDILDINCKNAKLYGFAKFVHSDKVPDEFFISGLDNAKGRAVFDNVVVPSDGEYVLTINIKKKGWYKKMLVAKVNDVNYIYDFPEQKFFNNTARFQQVVTLNKGVNVIELSNPVACRADSTALQYYKMGQALKSASKKVAQEKGEPIKPITFSVCEWGFNKPYKWGASVGNLWRTTMDIRPIWPWIVHLYSHTVKLYKYSGVGGWNDPDMLEVGNGKLTYDENKSHFSLWCMLSAPLILGNDLRSISQNTLDIVTNKNMIAIDQDPLGKQAKRIKSGLVDILAKPLAGGKTAICLFNKFGGKKKVSFDLQKLCDDKYVNMRKQDKYTLTEQWTGEVITTDRKIKVDLDKHSVKVYVI